MKKTILLLLLANIFMACSLIANTFRVNNKLTENADARIYADIQRAHDVAYNGDTLMIEGSLESYSGLNCSKKLVIKGPGYFFDKNPGLSVNKRPANVGYVSFEEGSAGSLITGVTILGNFYVYDNNIIISRCNCTYGLFLSSCDNIMVSGCYFPENSYTGFSGTDVSGLVATNNIILEQVYFSNGSTGTFLNNVFAHPNMSLYTGIELKNNILFESSSEGITLPTLPDPAIAYNISIGSQFGTDNHNIANAVQGDMFIGALSESTDGKWQLKEGSPAEGVGENSIDCGAFGGALPYQLSGIPAGPVIYELNVSSYSETGNSLPVTIKAKNY